MEGTVSKNGKIIMYTLAVLLLVVIAYVVYKIFFQFDNATVQTEVTTASNSYATPASAVIIINDAIKHIMASTYLTQEVLDYATVSGIPKEQVLVNAAVAQATNMGYL